MYKLIKEMYDDHRISATKVWKYADEGVITEEEALSICGLRPSEEA